MIFLSRKDTAFWQSVKRNNDTYHFYYNRLLDTAVNRYEWVGLPDTIDPRFLELTIFCDGCAVFFHDEVMGYLGLQAMYGGNLDVYHNPMQRTAYASNGYQKLLTEKDSVLIWNNALRMSGLSQLEQYAIRLYEVERAIDTNVKSQKTPILIRSSESQRLVMQNLYQKYDGNQPFIFGDKNLDIDGIKVLNTNAPFVADKLQLLKRQYWNEAMTFLGVDNVSTEKKERLVSDEVAGNLGAVEAQRLSGLNARREAVEKINKMFGLQISVDYRIKPQLMEEKREVEV